MPFRWIGSCVIAAAVIVTLPGISFAQTDTPAGYTETLRWYHIRAESGDARAQFLLAIKYETGTDVLQDQARARVLYQRAAGQGLADAQFKLATLLASDSPTAGKAEVVRKWYTAAALQRHAPAQYNLGLMLLRRAQDADGMAEAISWVMRAEAAGLAPAAGLLEKIIAAYPEPVVADARMLAGLPIGKSETTSQK